MFLCWEPSKSRAFKIKNSASSQGQNSHLPLFCHKALWHPRRREPSLLRALPRSCEKRERELGLGALPWVNQNQNKLLASFPTSTP